MTGVKKLLSASRESEIFGKDRGSSRTPPPNAFQVDGNSVQLIKSKKLGHFTDTDKKLSEP